MDIEKYVEDLLVASDCSALSLSEFAKLYINKLVFNLVTYVDSNISVGSIESVQSYSVRNELSQEITGIPGAYSAIDGNENVLAQFAEQYSKLGIEDFGLLAKEALLDFLNLHNGLFVVLLSKMNICELSLNAPTQNGNKLIGSEPNAMLTIIPVTFSYGTIRFVLGECPSGIKSR